MEQASQRRSRTIKTVSLAEVPTTKETMNRSLPTDLPTLFSELRDILARQSAPDDDVDSLVNRYVDAISTHIQQFSNLSSPTETFDAVQATMKTFINSILSLTVDLSYPIQNSLLLLYNALFYAQEPINLSKVYAADPSYARTVCHRSFDLLALAPIQNFLSGTYHGQLSQHIGYTLRLILSISGPTNEFIVFKKNELQDRVPTIRSLFEFVDRHVQNSDCDEWQTDLNAILTYLWILADDTSLVPTLLETDCTRCILQWLARTDLSLSIARVCISLVHNLARHDKGAKVLNDLNCLSVLKDFQKRVLDPNKDNDDQFFNSLRLVYYMSVSLLTEPKENREDLGSLRKILDELMQLAVNAGQSENNKFEGFHVSEVVVVLTKLCVHDQVLKYVMNESKVEDMDAQNQVDFFCELLVKFRGAMTGEDDLDQLTLIALFNIVWSISFHDEYLNELRTNSKFMMTVKSYAIDDDPTTVDQYVPRHMSPIQKAAHGILWNLDKDNPERTARPTAKPAAADDDGKQPEKGASGRTRVMVSYCHADKEFCRQLVDGLQKDKRLSVWVDFAYCHTDDLWEEIAEAIENASVVLLLMSKDYQDSKSCRQEVMYAKDSLKKRFIPIYTKKDFTATGWLGVRIVGPQYIRFGKQSFEETVKKLLDLIHDDKTSGEAPPQGQSKPPETTTSPPVTEEPLLTATQPPTETNPPASGLKPVNKPVDKWTRPDVLQWFDQNQIRRELADVYDFKHGSDLLLYGQCLRPDWQAEYADVKERFQKKHQSVLYRDQFVRFVGALNRLEASAAKPKSRTCVVS